MKKKPTIAQKKVKQKKKNHIFLEILSWILCLPLAGLAYIFTFVMQGYSFTALVCCVLIFIIAFYRITAQMHWTWIPMLRRIFTFCLVIGLILVAVTEAMIIQASFGSPQQDVDYIVVLGAKVRSTGPSASLWDRIRGAHLYLQAHPDVTAVLSGGQGVDEPMTEAQAMYDALVDLGISPQRLWLEDQATSTWENIRFTLDLIEEKTGHRPQKLGVVSSEYHLFRASLFAKKCGVEFVGIPAHTSRISQMINHFMREVAGVWHFWILGGNYNA